MNYKINARILIVDDDYDVLIAAKMFLKQHIAFIYTSNNPKEIPALLKNSSYNLVLLDMNYAKDRLSGQEGFFWLSNILEIDQTISVVLITAYGDVELAVQAIKKGATDFILKPWKNEKLLATITSALRLNESKQENESLKLKHKELAIAMHQNEPELLAYSDAMLKVLETIKKVGRTDANVLILGENGTGKELIARAIHNTSLRKNEIFVKVDLGAVSESLFESELFGHKKGAFTDAREDRTGKFELANKGTLFLDEIGNLTLPLQAKLLSILQNRNVTRLGSNKEIPIDVRLICATNMPLYEMIKENTFRQDLLYRVNTVELQVPPLRERIEDIYPLIQFFLKNYCEKYKISLKKINENTLKRLEKHTWPGNVRELQHAIERAVILSESEILEPTDFFMNGHKQDKNIGLNSYNLEETESILIQKALQKHGGNISKAAQELGLTRPALYRRIEKHGI